MQRPHVRVQDFDLALVLELQQSSQQSGSQRMVPSAAGGVVVPAMGHACDLMPMSDLSNPSHAGSTL